MTDDLEQIMRDSAAKPAKASVDSTTVEQHPLKDQIEVDRYLSSKKAARKKNAGIRLAKIVPPGAD